MEIELPCSAVEEEKCQIFHSGLISLSFQIVIYMKGLGYLEKVGLNWEEKRPWVMKMEGFLGDISIKEG